MVDLIMDAEMTFGEEDDEIEIQDLTPTAEDIIDLTDPQVWVRDGFLSSFVVLLSIL